jgi:D-3-phosphoglycerate dehydrogenase / 2-oxoglutarate reductase
MKVLISDKVSDKTLQILQAEKKFQVVNLTATPGAKLSEAIRDADALVIRSATKVTAELLESAPRLRAIGRAGVGVDNVDLEAATRRGVVVMNTPGGNATAVAEHTLALLLSLARRVPQADASLRQGRWEKKKLEGIELRGKTLGLIGMGKIGTEVARLARALEMEVLAYDPYVSSLVAREQQVRLTTFDGVLAASDFLSLHASATPETRHLINAKTLAKAKSGIRLVNCARGELIDQAALLEALESGQVAGAALDVFEKEPPATPEGQRLVTHANVVSTPHIAGSTEEAQEIVGIRIAEQVRDYLLTGVARNAVNMPSISVEEYKKLAPYIQLGEKLGAFVAQLASQRLEEVRISYDGGLAELNTHLVKNAVLKGVLNRMLSEQANLVNAGALAQARGLEVAEMRSARRAAYSNSLGIALKTETETASALGMVGVRGELRILGINDLDIDAPLKGYILYMRNQDVPGVIGRVGTILGNAKVNIANFALGRESSCPSATRAGATAAAQAAPPASAASSQADAPSPAGDALGLVNVDSPIPESVLDELRAIPAIRAVKVVQV